MACITKQGPHTQEIFCHLTSLNLKPTIMLRSHTTVVIKSISQPRFNTSLSMNALI